MSFTKIYQDDLSRWS